MTIAFDLQPQGVSRVFWSFVVVTVDREHHYHQANPIQPDPTLVAWHTIV